MQSPCTWSVTWDMVAECCPGSAVSTDQQTAALTAAVAAVWEATGRQFGVCADTAYPCRACSCGMSPCGCVPYDTIDLSEFGGRVVSVDTVVENGTTLSSGTDYAVLDYRWLVRKPTGTPWPTNQDPFAVPIPLSVAWHHGVAPPSDLVYNAVIPLACELARACAGEACALSTDRVQTVVREGVTFAMVAPGTASDEGLFGIPRIDAAIRRANPGGVGSAITGASDPVRLLRPAAVRVT